MTSNLRSLHLALVAALFFFAGCSTPVVRADEAEEYYRRADFYQAFVAISDAKDMAPDDERIARRYREFRIAYLLDRARGLIFSDREIDALVELERVLALDPENSIAPVWVQKAKAKLADRAIYAGDNHRISGELEAAMQSYNEALQHEPGNELATEGIKKLGERWDEMQERARGHYLKGVRTFAEDEFGQARYHMELALDKDPTLEAAQRPADVARRRLADATWVRAQEMEAEGLYHPALREYRAIAEEFPDYEGVHDRIAHAEKEVEAAAMADLGEVLMFRREYAKARETLEKAFEHSTSQRTEISDLMITLLEREMEDAYLHAKDLELQNVYDKALEAYRAIDEASEGFRDVKARISLIELNIEEAKKAFDAGMQAETNGDKEAALGHYADVELFWPGYQDVRARVQRLRGNQ